MRDRDAGYYALRAHDLVPSWSEQLVAAFLGLNLRDKEDEEDEGEGGGGGGGGGGDGNVALHVSSAVHLPPLNEDECRVTRSGDGEAIVEVASLKALEVALMRDGACRVMSTTSTSTSLSHAALITIH